MKPFDLEAAKRGDPLVTRDGNPARFIAHVPEARPGWRVVVMIEGQDCPSCRHDDGMLMHFSGGTSGDIFMAPKKRLVWVNMYESATATWWPTEELADSKKSARDRIGGKAWPLEIEE